MEADKGLWIHRLDEFKRLEGKRLDLLNEIIIDEVI